jgi:hypothetical protein
MIYECALGGNEVAPYTDTKHAQIHSFCCSPYGRYDIRDTDEAWQKLFDLGRACRQLREETKRVPYTANVFNIALGGEFGWALSQLKPSRKRAITTVSFGFKAWVQIDPDTYAYTVPEELKDCTGLKTVISVVTLRDTQKKMVEAFAKKRRLKLLIESEGISDERSSWMDIDDESAEYEAYCNGEYEEEEEYF